MSTIYGDAGNNTLTGTVGDDSISGGAGNDTINGSKGNDWIDAGTGIDWVDGGVGTDTLSLDRSGLTGALTYDAVAAATGAGTILADGSHVANVEQLEYLLTGSGDDTLKVSAKTGAFYWNGNDGHDTLVADYSTRIDAITASSNGTDFYIDTPGYSNPRTGSTYAYAENIEAVSLIGGKGNDTFNGTLGDDTFTGGKGNDYLVGGAGSDTAAYSGRINDYKVTYDGSQNTWSVSDLRAGTPDGTDTLVSIENLRFSDGVRTVSSYGSLMVGTAGDDSLTGLPSDDTLSGLGGNDTLMGGPGHDSLMGGDGNDYLFDLDGSSTALGGDGNDTIQAYGHLEGGSGDDFIGHGDPDGRAAIIGSAFGGDGNDTIAFGGFNTYGQPVSGINTIDGGAGDDVLSGDLASDSISGGMGNDQLWGSGGNDSLDGGNGVDYAFYYGGKLADFSVTHDAGTGVWTVTDLRDGSPDGTDDLVNVERLVFSDDYLTIGDATGLNLTGTAGKDYLNGTIADDTLNGLAGNDELYGGDGNDTLNGGNDNDYMDGGAGHDSLVGGDGDDYLQGGSFTDTLIGGLGNDSMYDNDGDTTVSGGDGNDYIESYGHLDGGDGDDFIVNAYYISSFAHLSGAPESVTGGDGNDTIRLDHLYFDDTSLTLSGANTIDGGTGNDSIIATRFSDIVYGGTGNDTLNGGEGSDTLYGGAGNDVYVVGNTGAVVSEQSGATDDGGIDRVESSISYSLGQFIENLILTGSDDLKGAGNTLANVILGNAGNNTLSGLTGNDSLDGGAGNDTLAGGKGNDWLQGGTGSDQFVFAAPGSSNGKDTISDFVHGTDWLVFHKEDYLSSAKFTVGTAASGAGAQFVWDAATHTLSYDHDGQGGDAAIAVAVFTNGAAIDLSDIHII